MTREKEIERYLVKQVEKRGGKAYKWVSPGNKGVPDRIVFFYGCVFLVELKAKKGKLSAAQKRQHITLADLGRCPWLVNSKEGVDVFIRCTTNEIRS